MKYLVTGMLLTAGLLSACSGSGRKEILTAGENQKTIVKVFSDSLQADTFKLRIEGSNPKEMQMIFTITSSEGKQIYYDNIKATDLFKSYDAKINLDKKNNQIKFLNEELMIFFDEENFIEPAVTKEEKSDQHVPDKNFYEELKGNQLNGFSYRLGKDKKLYIAWSDAEKKVKPYYICCN